MKIPVRRLALACVLFPLLACAQDAKLKIPEFKSLAGKATESVDISISPWLLRMAGAFIDKNDPDAAATKQMLGGIKSIQIRNYEFAADFVYSAADIDAVRQQLTGPGWSQIMQVHDRDKSEDVDMYLLVENEQTKGFALIASEPRQFTIINIVGSFNIDDLPRLQKQLHLPKAAAAQTRLLM
jgi:Domain of unknown function (DUF4252)